MQITQEGSFEVKKFILSALPLIMLFCACTTSIPSFDEIVEQNHIPQGFKNLDSSLASENSEALSQKDKDAKRTNIMDNLESTPFSLKQFNALIDDATLHKLLGIALAKNTNVLTMISRINQAKSQMKINTANMLPSVNAGINSSYIDRSTLQQSTTIRTGANTTNANVSMSWEVDLFGKLNALRKSSKKAYAQAQNNLAYAQISLIADVATLYFTLRDNANAINIAKQTLANLESIQEANENRLKIGLIDIATFQSFVSATNAQRNSLESLQYTFEQNLNALLVLLNIPLSELEVIVKFLDSAYELPSVAEFYINDMPSEIILSRPDIESTLFALHSQLYKETNANAARLPTISLSGSIGEVLYSSNGAGNIVFQIASSITAPLLNRTSLKQNYLIQKELSKEAYYTLQNSINTALSEVENALFNLQSQKRQVQNTTDSRNISLRAYNTNSARLKRGLLDKSDFLSNENTYLSAENQLHSAKANELLSFITLFKALGGNLAYNDTESSQTSIDSSDVAQSLADSKQNLESSAN